MKSIATILLSFYFLLAGLMPNTDFHELAKLPGLVTHFIDHDQDCNGSLLAFLKLHYGSEDQLENTHHDQHDESLPLHEHNSGHTHIFISFLAPIVIVSQKKLTENISSEYRFIISSEFLHSIFQPPKA